ncbi:MAG: acyl-coenzyme A thioesterase PaaI-like protein [Bacteriovoracaceae bacterium]|jgi:acyl-coenzyme A thioesterase PaaI-like protein
MSNKIYKIVDKLLGRSESKLGLIVLQKVLNSAIPFNLPHKFKFIELSEIKTRISLPYIKHNRNHLGGIHACAIAALGEYTSGLAILKNFGFTKYRIILSDLHINYIKQAKEEVTGEVKIDQEELVRVIEELNSEGISEISLATNIINNNDEIVSVVQSTWQLKDWDQIKR